MPHHRYFITLVYEVDTDRPLTVVWEFAAELVTAARTRLIDVDETIRLADVTEK